ncbi:unnamed protein product, partial [marine sediment metagenome]
QILKPYCQELGLYWQLSSHVRQALFKHLQSGSA